MVRRVRGVLVVGTVVAALVAGCSSGGSDGADPAPDALEAGTVEIDAHGGVGQVWLVAEPDLDVVLLDAAGCRGLTVGGARFSPKHANFVENMGAATTAERRGRAGRNSSRCTSSAPCSDCRSCCARRGR